MFFPDNLVEVYETCFSKKRLAEEEVKFLKSHILFPNTKKHTYFYVKYSKIVKILIQISQYLI